MKLPCRLRYRFERLRAGAPSRFEAFGLAAEELVRREPLALPTRSFGVASKVSSGVLDLEGVEAQAQSDLRLKSVEQAGRLLLENVYDSRGRLVETGFPDGEIVRYRYDKEGRLAAVLPETGEKIELAYDAAGRRCSVAYGRWERSAFGYRWSDRGRLLAVDLPQGWLRYVRDQAGTVLALESDHGRMVFKASRNGKPPGVEVSTGLRTVTFSGTSGTAAVAREGALGNGGHTMLSPLGIHCLDAAGRVRAWLRWDGDYMNLSYRPDGLIHEICSRQGLSLLDCGEGGSVSLFGSDGRRFLRLRDGNGGTSLIIGTTGVFLLRYDDSGRLQRLQDSWGGCISYGYGRFRGAPAPTDISSPRWGRVVVGYGKKNRVASVAVDGKGRVDLKYGRGTTPDSVSWKAKDLHGLAEVCALAGWLYSLRSAGLTGYRDALQWANFL